MTDLNALFFEACDEAGFDRLQVIDAMVALTSSINTRAISKFNRVREGVEAEENERSDAELRAYEARRKADAAEKTARRRAGQRIRREREAAA